VGAKEKVEVSIDYISSQGNGIQLKIAAEGQAKSGHDILAMPTWWPHAQADLLEPVNDIMEPLIKLNGEVNRHGAVSRKAGDKWLAVPATIGSQIKGPCTPHRPDEKNMPASTCRRCIGRQPPKPTTGRWIRS